MRHWVNLHSHARCIQCEPGRTLDVASVCEDAEAGSGLPPDPGTGTRPSLRAQLSPEAHQRLVRAASAEVCAPPRSFRYSIQVEKFVQTVRHPHDDKDSSVVDRGCEQREPTRVPPTFNNSSTCDQHTVATDGTNLMSSWFFTTGVPGAWPHDAPFPTKTCVTDAKLFTAEK